MLKVETLNVFAYYGVVVLVTYTLHDCGPPVRVHRDERRPLGRVDCTAAQGSAAVQYTRQERRLLARANIPTIILHILHNAQDIRMCFI